MPDEDASNFSFTTAAIDGHSVKPPTARFLFAELYDLAFAESTVHEIDSLKFIWKAILPSTPGTLCEVGAGTGRFCIPLAQLGIRCAAVEPDGYMLDVLKCRQRRLAPAAAARITTVPMGFQNFEVGQKFEAIIAMTDTLSYFWPLREVRQLIAKSRQIVSKRGVLIIDIGLWRQELGETREENWKTELPEGSITTRYRARIEKVRPESTKQPCLARIENLSFSATLDGVRIRVSRQGLLHAFTYRSIAVMSRQLGFELVMCVLPGTRQTVSECDRYLRMLMAFIPI